MVKLDFQNIGFRYSSGDQFIIENLNWTVQSSQIVGLIGTNGAGKSTLFKLILGILSSEKGKILINQTEITGMKSTKELISFVPENAKLFLVGPTPRKDLVRILRNQTTVDKLLIKSELDHLADKKLYHLSEGQRRLFAIFNAFHLKRKILLFDEPTIGLDESGRSLFLQLLAKARQEDKLVIVASNDTRLFPYADELAVLQNGSIFLHGTPHDVLYKLETQTKLMPNQIVRLIQNLESNLNRSLPHCITVDEFNAQEWSK